MGKLIKSLSSLISILVIASVVVGIIGWFNLPSILSRKMSEKFKVEVSIGKFIFSFSKLGIEEFSISNPKNSIISTALRVGSAIAYAPILNYIKEEVVIDEIIIDQVYLGLEFNTSTGSDGNWTVLMNNLNNALKKGREESKREAERNILIKKLIIRTINTDIVFKDQKNPKVTHFPTIDQLEFTNISSSGGFPMDQVMSSVLGKMLESIFIKENLKNMLDSVLKSPEKALNDIINPFKGLLNTNFETKEELLHSA